MYTIEDILKAFGGDLRLNQIDLLRKVLDISCSETRQFTYMELKKITRMRDLQLRGNLDALTERGIFRRSIKDGNEVWQFCDGALNSLLPDEDKSFDELLNEFLSQDGDPFETASTPRAPEEIFAGMVERATSSELKIRRLSREEGEVLEQCGILYGMDSEAAALALLMRQFEYRFADPLVPADGTSSAYLSNAADSNPEAKASLIAANFHRSFSSLIGRGLATSCVVEGESRDSSVGYVLSESFVQRFYGGRPEFIKEGPASKYVDVIRPGSIRRKELYFSGVSADKIRRLESVMEPDNYGRVMERQAARGRNRALLYLFHGEPGTGKTEECRQLALRSGRILLMADAAKLQGTWVGESEKAYRGIFRTMRYVSAVSGKAPILLFNEADSVIGRRNPEAVRSIDKMENTLLSILLQELEAMEGVFIATTNLPTGIDPAFINRFIDKIEFPVPDDRVRMKIWRNQLPQLDEAILAEVSRYRISGRSIEHIAQKCDTDEVLEGAFPGRERVMAYCEEESAVQTKFNDAPDAEDATPGVTVIAAGSNVKYLS